MPHRDTSKNSSCYTTYENVVNDMHELYNNELSSYEAHEAARNFIGWMQTLIEIERDSRHNSGHEQSD